jgi:hypothetical protein
VGAQAQKDRSTDEVARFSARCRFENKAKLDDLGLEIDPNK